MDDVVEAGPGWAALDPYAPDADAANDEVRHRLGELADFAGDAARSALLEAVRLASGAAAAHVVPPGDAGVGAPVDGRPADTVRIPLPRAGAAAGTGEGAVLDLVGVSPRAAELDLVQFCSTLIAAQVHAATQAEGVRRAMRHRSAVDEVVSATHVHRDVDQVLAVAVEALRAGMLSQGVGIRAFDVPGSAAMKRYAAVYPPEAEVLITDEIIEISGRAARVCWERQTVSLLHIDEPDVEPLTTAAERDLILDFMRYIGAREMLMAPLGSGAECQGWLTLTRLEEHEPFGADDVAVVLSIGREVGRVIRHARDFERQRDLIARLRRLSDHKSRFTATLAHQLKNPLTSIQGHVEMAQDALEDADGQPAAGLVASSVRAIDRGARRMAHITGSMLDLSRLEQPERLLRVAEVALDRLLLEGADVIAAAAANGGVRLDTSAVQPAVVCGAADELDMVVDNLLSNAVKYSPEGSTVRLGVRPASCPVRAADVGGVTGTRGATVRGGAGALLWCEDEGMGMSAEDVDRLFDAFHRADDARQRQISGTGLGMAILAAAVDRHGGAVHVDSEVGVGTRIEVWLPHDPPASGGVRGD